MPGSRSADELLFGEGPGAFVVSGPRNAFAAFGAAATVLGTVGGEALRLAGAHGVLAAPVAELGREHADGLARLMH